MCLIPSEGNRNWSKPRCRRIILNSTKMSNVLFPFIYWFNNLGHTWHCSINVCTYIVGKYIIYLYSLRNREEKLTGGLLFLLFRKLLVINLYLLSMHIYFLFVTWRHCMYLIYCSKSKLQRSITMLSWCWRNQEVSN